MVGDHLLAEGLHVRTAGLRFGEPAGVDVDLVGGDDDRCDLRVVDALAVRTCARKQQQARTDNDWRFHEQLLDGEPTPLVGVVTTATAAIPVRRSMPSLAPEERQKRLCNGRQVSPMMSTTSAG